MSVAVTRRRFLRLLAGLPILAAGGGRAVAASTSQLGRLIEDAQAHSAIAQRIEQISRALLGTKYAAHTLIGGPKRPEVFVVRDDAFDCVTYCEVVLAAALARDVREFAPALRQIRYHHGDVSWRERNHYFADWCERNLANRLCRPVAIDGMVKITKASNSEPALGKREWMLEVIPQAVLLSNSRLLEPGDIVGFVSRRANLDYSHTGFVAFGKDRSELLLRHASSTRRRVIDEKMERFIAANGVRHVTVLRPQERPAPQNSSKNIPT
jgi:hypothetical protein